MLLKSGSEEMFDYSGLSPTRVLNGQFEHRFGLTVIGSCPLGPSKKGAAGIRPLPLSQVIYRSWNNADLIESIMLVTDQHMSEPSVHKYT